MEQLTFDLGEPPRKVGGYANRRYKDRPCDGCGEIYTPYSSQQRRCPPCQRQRDLASKREGMRRLTRKRAKRRACVDCGAELPPPLGRPPVRCAICAPIHRKAMALAKRARAVENGARKRWNQAYRERHPDAARESSRRYRQAHPEVGMGAVHRRRQRTERKMDAVDRLLSSIYRRAIRNDPCFYCGAAIARDVDHFFPLSKGGTDHWWNLVSACQRCNRGPRGKGATCGTAFLMRRGTRDLAAAA